MRFCGRDKFLMICNREPNRDALLRSTVGVYDSDNHGLAAGKCGWPVRVHVRTLGRAFKKKYGVGPIG